MMMIIIILTASYIGDDVRIVYALAIYDAIFFGSGRTDGRTFNGSSSRSFVADYSRFRMCQSGDTCASDKTIQLGCEGGLHQTKQVNLVNEEGIRPIQYSWGAQLSEALQFTLIDGTIGPGVVKDSIANTVQCHSSSPKESSQS